METNTELALNDARRSPSPATMMQMVIEKGVTAENVSVLEKLIDLHEKIEARQAEKEFSAAFVALQKDLPTIVAETVIPNRGKYQRYEDVWRDIGSIVAKHGFSVSFSMDFKENRVLETCHLRHTGGHSQSNSFAVRTGKGDSETQADCKAATTAKRNALLNALNIVIRQDVLQDEEGDARLEGEKIPFDYAQTLRERVKDTRSDEQAFLKFAGVEKYEDILMSKYDGLVEALNRKAKR